MMKLLFSMRLAKRGRLALILESAELLVSQELGFERDDLDDAGPAFLCNLSVILVHGRELPDVGQGVADSSRRQEVLPCYSKVIGTLYLLLRSHTSLAADPQDPVGTSVRTADHLTDSIFICLKIRKDVNIALSYRYLLHIKDWTGRSQRSILQQFVV